MMIGPLVGLCICSMYGCSLIGAGILKLYKDPSSVVGKVLLIATNLQLESDETSSFESNCVSMSCNAWRKGSSKFGMRN